MKAVGSCLQLLFNFVITGISSAKEYIIQILSHSECDAGNWNRPQIFGVPHFSVHVHPGRENNSRFPDTLSLLLGVKASTQRCLGLKLCCILSPWIPWSVWRGTEMEGTSGFQNCLWGQTSECQATRAVEGLSFLLVTVGRGVLRLCVCPYFTFHGIFFGRL